MQKKKNIKSIISYVISAVLLAIALLVIINIVVAKVRHETPSFFGFSFHIVVSDSMTPEINVGEFIVTKQTELSEIAIGDNIAFKSPDPALSGKVIIHKVVEVNSVDGIISFRTQGIISGADVDEYPVTNIIGKYVGKSAFFGAIILFLKVPINWLFIIVLGVLLYFIIKLIKQTIKQSNEVKNNKE